MQAEKRNTAPCESELTDNVAFSAKLEEEVRSRGIRRLTRLLLCECLLAIAVALRCPGDPANSPELPDAAKQELTRLAKALNEQRQRSITALERIKKMSTVKGDLTTAKAIDAEIKRLQDEMMNPSQPEIIKVEYGRDDKRWVDVTDEVRSMLQDPKTPLVVGVDLDALLNGAKGDPAPFQAKTLRVTYKINWEELVADFPSGATVKLPKR